ncbi:MAG: metallopeptidase TldD-related protein [Bacteroidales bacterium]
MYRFINVSFLKGNLNILFSVFSFFLFFNHANGNEAFEKNDSLLLLLQNELNREMEELSKAETPPYYMAYRVNDLESVSLKASLGSVVNTDHMSRRIAGVSVRVGDYNFDNTRVEDNSGGYSPYQNNVTGILPGEDKPEAINHSLWLLTDQAYKEAVTTYNQLVQKEKYNKNQKKNGPDFSVEEPGVHFEPRQKSLAEFDFEPWKKILSEVTGEFLKYPDIVQADAFMNYFTERKYLVSTEGSSVVQNFSYAQLHLLCAIREKDGTLVPYYKTFTGLTPDQVLDNVELLPEAKNIAGKLRKLLDAPMAEPYTGPAILSPHATGVFFHEIFGHRIESHRFKGESDGQTFAKKLGEKVLPKFMNVQFNPLVEEYNTTPLIGNYKYDDEGVKAEKVDIIRNGILVDFLRSRIPYGKKATSNGHGRAMAGVNPVARQSNMFVTSEKPKTEKELRKLLIKECKKQDLPYGYYFKEVIGGFTFTQRSMPNVFNIIPLEVYRVYTDKRPDELVKGVDLIGTPLVMFSKIKATSENYEVFNGFCGAESGNVPVSTIAPAMFVTQIETQLKNVQKMKVPVLNRPWEGMP